MNYLCTWSAPAFCQLHVHHGGGLIKLIIRPLLFSSFHLCNHLKKKKKKKTVLRANSALLVWRASYSLGTAAVSHLGLAYVLKWKIRIKIFDRDCCRPPQKCVTNKRESQAKCNFSDLFVQQASHCTNTPAHTLPDLIPQTSLRLMETDMPRKKK